MREERKVTGKRETTYKNTAKIHIGGRTVEVDIEALAKAIATNQVDWPAYMGKAERVARVLPEILKCVKVERDLF